MSDAAHILVVDDDDRIRELLKRFLSREGYRVTAAPDAEAARRLMGTMAFDMAILDVMMPGEDGLSLLSGIRKGASRENARPAADGAGRSRRPDRRPETRRRRLSRQTV